MLMASSLLVCGFVYLLLVERNQFVRFLMAIARGRKIKSTLYCSTVTMRYKLYITGRATLCSLFSKLVI